MLCLTFYKNYTFNKKRVLRKLTTVNTKSTNSSYEENKRILKKKCTYVHIIFNKAEV